MIVTSTDITARKQMEEAHRQAAEDFDRYFNVALELLCVVDAAGVFLRLNPAWEKALGYKTSEMVGKRLFTFIHPDDLARTVEVFNELKAGRNILYGFINRDVHKDGSYRWLEWHSVVTEDKIFASARDITERIALENVAKEQEQLLRYIVKMSAGTLSGIFVPFVQAETGLARERGGLGLGLALVKGLLDLHEGTIEAFSEGVGKGSKFVVHLPLAIEGKKSLEPSRDAGKSAPVRILIIEDNVDAAVSLRAILEFSWNQTHVALDGALGLKEVQAYSPDLVLCDIGLPGEMDGYAVARAIRANPRYNHIYLAALTGYGQEEDKRRSTEAGFDRHLTKPVDIDVLMKLADELRSSKPRGDTLLSSKDQLSH